MGIANAHQSILIPSSVKGLENYITETTYVEHTLVNH